MAAHLIHPKCIKEACFPKFPQVPVIHTTSPPTSRPQLLQHKQAMASIELRDGTTVNPQSTPPRARTKFEYACIQDSHTNGDVGGLIGRAETGVVIVFSGLALDEFPATLQMSSKIVLVSNKDIMMKRGGSTAQFDSERFSGNMWRT